MRVWIFLVTSDDFVDVWDTDVGFFPGDEYRYIIKKIVTEIESLELSDVHSEVCW
jgi:hypothetical protein